MSAIAIGIIAVLGVLGVAAGVMVPAYLRQRIPWKTSPAGFTYHSVSGLTSEANLDFAILHAFLYLRQWADFTPSTLERARRELRVIVQRDIAWSSPLHGSNVAGITSGTTIDVGRDFKALCHELAHACEFIEGGRAAQDDQHKTWSRRGIHRAVDEFERLMTEATR